MLLTIGLKCSETAPISKPLSAQVRSKSTRLQVMLFHCTESEMFVSTIVEESPNALT